MPPATSQAQARTRAFARVLGPFVAILTTTYAIRLPSMTDFINDLLGQPAIMFMIAVVMIIGGLVIVGGHRSWRGPTAVVISLFGWFVLLRGAALVAIPDAIQAGVDATLLSPTAVAVAQSFFAILAVLGLWLTYAGWFSKAEREAVTSRAELG